MMLRALRAAVRPRCSQAQLISRYALSSLQPQHQQSSQQILSPLQQTIVEAEGIILNDLHTMLLSVEAGRETIQLVEDLRARIDDVYSVVIAGEFNSGKSSLINSLLGMGLCSTGVLPTTGKITILRGASAGTKTTLHGAAQSLPIDDVAEIVIDNAGSWLKNVAVIDTPGTNALLHYHEQLTTKIVPRADLVIFVTSAERPMTESEAQFLGKIKAWGKKVIIVINKIDIIPQDGGDRDRILEYVSSSVTRLLDRQKVPVFALSAREALAAKLSNGPDSLGSSALFAQSGLAALETHLLSTLGERELVRSKLEGILRVCDRLVEDAAKAAEERGVVIDSDIRALEMVDEAMTSYRGELARDKKYFAQSVDSLCDQASKRLHTFLDANMTILKPRMLYDQRAFTEAYQREVVIDFQRPINDLIQEVGALLEDRSRAQARNVIDFIGSRPFQVQSGMIGGVSREADFEKIRLALVTRLRRDTSDALAAHDQASSVERIGAAAAQGFYGAAALQALSASGVAAMMAAHILDASGLGIGLGMGLLSLLVVPQQRASARRDFDERVAALRSRLHAVVDTNLEREFHLCSEKIIASIQPYSSFVSREKAKIESVRSQVGGIKARLHTLRAQI